VEVDVTSAAVVRRKMKHRVNPLHRGAGHTGLPQVGLQKINLAGAEMPPNVVEVAAAQIVDDANFGGAARQELIG
jgi:hypothetical protein